MNYVTTNIRISEEEYLRLKEEAARKRTSLAAIIRGKISQQSFQKSPDEILKTIRKHAAANVQYLKGVDIVNVVRQMRDQAYNFTSC